jgi:hypothetical protein
MSWKRFLGPAILVVLAVPAVVLLLTSVFGGRKATYDRPPEQRIVIVERLEPGDAGSFRLSPRSPGTLKPDAGPLLRGREVDTLTGTRGTLHVRRGQATGTWSVLDGTGAYSGLQGGGRLTEITAGVRAEGFVQPTH